MAAPSDSQSPRAASPSIQPQVETWEEVSHSYAVDAGPADEDLAKDLIRLLHQANLEPPKRLLEVGCGSGHLSLLLRQAGYETDLLDFSETALAKAQEAYAAACGPDQQAKFIKGDLMRMSEQVPAGGYDVVWNSGVMEHFSRDSLQTGLQQMAAAARHAVLLIVPNPASLLYLAFRLKVQAIGQWEYGVELLRDDYQEVIQASGLQLVSHGYCGKQFTRDQLQLVISDEQDRGYWEQVLASGACPEQSLYLQYFFCAPQGQPTRKLRIADDALVLERTLQLDAMGAANLAAAQLRKRQEAAETAAEANRTADQALIEQLQTQNRELTQCLATLRADEQQRNQAWNASIAELSRQFREHADRFAALDAQLAETRQVNQRQTAEIAQAQRVAGQQAEAIAAMESQLAESRRENQSQATELDQALRAIDTAQADLAAVKAQLADSQHKVAWLTADLAEALRQREIMEAEHRACREDRDQAISNLLAAQEEMKSHLAQQEHKCHELLAKLSNEERSIKHLQGHAAGMDALVKELAYAVNQFRTSRAYKMGNVIHAARTRPLAALGRCTAWATGYYKRRGTGLVGALGAGDPLLPVQNRLQWAPLPAPLEPLDPLIARARQAPGTMFFVSSVDWRIYLAQRNHHFVRQYARRGYISIYDVSDFVGYDFTGFKEIEPNLFLFRGMPDQINQLPGLTLWTFCYNYHYRDRYPAAEQVIYDLIDDFAVHPFDLKLLEENHRRALSEATLAAYVARHLVKHFDSRPDALYLPNGVDEEHFGAAYLPVPEQDEAFAAVLARKQPIAGYYGAMAEWFDYDLLDEVARLRPDWQFVLIGPAYDKSVEDKPVFDRDNVTWIGPRDYAVLPRYLRALNVAMIPFQINEITLATSPLKLYEFFAGSKPVVTTPMPECVAFPEVQIAADAKEFSQALDRCLALGQDAAHLARLRQIAHENSWSERVRVVEEALAASSGADHR